MEVAIMLSFGWLFIVLLIGTANGGEVPLAFRLSLQKIGHEFNEKVEKDQWKTNSFYRGFSDDVSIGEKPLYKYSRFVIDDPRCDPGHLKGQTWDYLDPIMQYHVVEPANNPAILLGVELFFDGKDSRKRLSVVEFEKELGLSTGKRVDMNAWLSTDFRYNYITTETGKFSIAYLFHKDSLISALVADKKSLALLDTPKKERKQSQIREIDCFGSGGARRIVKLTDNPAQWLNDNNDTILKLCGNKTNAERVRRSFLRLAERDQDPNSLMTYNSIEKYCKPIPITEWVGKFPVGYKKYTYYSADGQIRYNTMEQIGYFSVMFVEMFKGFEIDCSKYNQLNRMTINGQKQPLKVAEIQGLEGAKIVAQTPKVVIVAVEDRILLYEDDRLAYIKMISDKFDTLSEYHKNLCVINLLKDRNILPKVCSYHEIYETK